jgi:tyrosine-protein kinase Etk/Wzc
MEGRRVLLFDGDMRRPQLKPHFASAEGPGLSELLQGKASFDQAVQRSKIPGVDVLGAIEGSVGASELAGSSRCTEALRMARERYDFVLLDSAPVGAVSESALIARRADVALLVIREAQTTRSAAVAAKKQLERMEVKILGAVLNCASKGAGEYGYDYPAKSL